ncbi:MAG TPA: peptidylprolyl isomerase [Terracidiphilus sp.]|jgi:peptidyl-prolyl cis-trans isomerase D|nr:peptidylprolyl isomerase [Terracidiphilus sp.]
MIRFLQKENRLTKALFIVIIGAASVSMVVYLIPGLTGQGSSSADTFAVVYPHWYSRFLSAGEVISQQKVAQIATQRVQQQYPQYAGNPMIMNMIEPQVGQQLVQQQILLDEANRLGIHVTNSDVRTYLQTGPAGQVLFPGGKFIGQDKYEQLIQQRFETTVADFEDSVKNDIAVRRLESLITAGVNVSDKDVRDAYRKNNIKIKFDYAVISSDDLGKTINPSDAELQAFFTKNSARYAKGVPEERTITYFAFTPDQVPGGVAQPTQQEIQQYYTAHQSEYAAPEQARARHILIQVPQGADAKTDAAAKAKADGLLKQIQGGANFADLAKKNSDDPGSKDSGGELGFAQRGRMVPEFDNAIFTQKIGDTKIVKTQYGYHIVQVEERQAAHTQSLSEVLPTIQATLIRQKSTAAQQSYAQALTTEAIKDGLQKTADAHHLQLVTTPPVSQQGVIAALPDSTGILSKAFQSKQGDPAQSAPTGEGFAIFQVTGITAAHAPTFADWKSHVLDDYRAEQLPVLLRQKTMDLANQAKSMNDLAKAAKAVGATVKTSDLVGETSQVPDLGDVGQLAPQLFEMVPGNISGPINAGRTGVVAKIDMKTEPSPDDIAKNLDQTREQILDQRRGEAFQVFATNIINDYKKRGRVVLNTKTQSPQLPGM